MPWPLGYSPISIDLPGLEPRLPGPKPSVLPLNYRSLARWDSNPLPLASQASALSNELRTNNFWASKTGCALPLSPLHHGTVPLRPLTSPRERPSARWESNPRPPGSKPGAPSTELRTRAGSRHRTRSLLLTRQALFQVELYRLKYWGRESNPHVRRHRFLRPARLPLRHPSINPTCQKSKTSSKVPQTGFEPAWGVTPLGSQPSVSTNCTTATTSTEGGSRTLMGFPNGV